MIIYKPKAVKKNKEIVLSTRKVLIESINVFQKANMNDDGLIYFNLLMADLNLIDKTIEDCTKDNTLWFKIFKSNFKTFGVRLNLNRLKVIK